MSTLGAIVVLALVGGRAINDRDVKISLGLENPKTIVFNSQGEPPSFTASDLETGLQKVITEVMILEESKVLALQSVSSREIELELARVRKIAGSKNWNEWLKFFDSNETEMRSKISDRIRVQKIIEDRLKGFSATIPGDSRAQSVDASANALREWLEDLRRRYRVRRMAPAPSRRDAAKSP